MFGWFKKFPSAEQSVESLPYWTVCLRHDGTYEVFHNIVYGYAANAEVLVAEYNARRASKGGAQ